MPTWFRRTRIENSREAVNREHHEQAPHGTSTPVTLTHMAISQYDQSSSSSQPERPVDPLGLTVLWQPAQALPSVDIIFVHGLGGRSMHTWSIDEELQTFWPRQWLRDEPVIQTARISTFGYNAKFLSRGPRKVFNIANFAKELLSELRVGQDEAQEALNIGEIPVVFVVHSMGGLVVKKAYILAANDDSYKDIAQSTCAILFLSTPHRGSDLAGLLNRLVKLFVPGRATKHYIAELKRNSSTLEEINDQFRHFAPRIEIVSFYETLETVIGLHEKMILDKDSSVLGYSGERTIPLEADHHGVCKFPNREDPSYIKIRKVLKDLVGRLGLQNLKRRNSRSRKMMHLVRTLLAVTQAPDEDHEFFHHRKMGGSCEWILSESTFLSWLDDPSTTSRVVWFHGAPGTGKSVLASYVVEYIRAFRSLPCQFFYFRYENQAKTLVGSLLRSIAYQTACHIPAFEQRLAGLSEGDYTLENAGVPLIWRKVYLDHLFDIPFNRPIYWVIDALDECTSPELLLSLLGAISISKCPIRIMFVGRWTQRLSTAFLKLSSTVKLDVHQMQAANEDLVSFVNAEIRNIPGNTSLKAKMVSRIMDPAEGNFLWARLILEGLRDCRTEKQMEDVLESLPHGLELLYQYMVTNLSENWIDGDRDLAKAVVTWAAFSRIPLTIVEMSRALEPESSMLLDFQATIRHVCGNFIETDRMFRVNIVHHTAREYLTKRSSHDLYVYPPDAHRTILKKCLSVLIDPKQEGSESFVQYAATSWPYHLGSVDPIPNDELLPLLLEFFEGGSVLRWICILSYSDELRQLVRASKLLRSFLHRDEGCSERSPLLCNLNARSTLELWGIEMLRIRGKFSQRLLRHPKAIHDLIPPFCPPESPVHRYFAKNSSVSSMVVTGLSKNSWDDSLLKFCVERDCRALKILCIEQYFAILTSSPNGRVRIFFAVSSEEARSLCHGERVVAMQFSNSGQMLATYGYQTIKVWDIATAQVISTCKNPAGTRVLAMGFQADDGAIFACLDDRIIRRFVLSEPNRGWDALEHILEGDGSSDGRRFKAPCCASFNPRSTLMAVGYQGCPLSVWDLSNPGLVGSYKREASEDDNGYAGRADLIQIGWNPVSGDVFGTYNDGCMFKWHPKNHSGVQVLGVDATIIKCSPTGSFLITTDDCGTLKVWNFDDFSLIYELLCSTTVNDLAVNPDGKRLYDLRGAYCNIWEPNSLIRLAESDERVSDTSSVSTSLTHVSKAAAEMPEPVEALAVGRKTSIYCTGHPSGVLKIFESGENFLLKDDASSVAISHVMWCDDERRLAIADVGTRVWVKNFDRVCSSLSTVFKETLGERVEQMLFNKDANLLLVVTQNFLNVWSVEEKVLRWRMPLSRVFRWINHPYNDNQLIGFGMDDIYTLRWHTIEDLGNFRMSKLLAPLSEPLDPAASAQVPVSSLASSMAITHIERVLASGDGSLLLLYFSETSSPHRRRKQFWLVRTADIDFSDSLEKTKITAFAIPQQLHNRIEIPLGFLNSKGTFSHLGRQASNEDLAGDHLAFLDEEGWLCSSSSDFTNHNVSFKRHFFLPQDWLNLENIELAQVTGEGLFLCPKDGEVAVVQNGFMNDWPSN